MNDTRDPDWLDQLRADIDSFFSRATREEILACLDSAGIEYVDERAADPPKRGYGNAERE